MNSRDYWLQREQEQLKHNITDEKEYDKQLHQIYQNMLDACQKEIDSFYAKYASAEGITLAEAKKRVSQHDVKAFERKAAKYVKEKDFSAKANEELRLYNATMKINRLEMLKANIGLETIAGHDEMQKFMEGILKGRTEDELKRQAGILGKTVLNNAAKANAIVNGSFHSGTFSDRIWQYQDLMRQDLGRLLQQGLIQGKGARAIAKDLKKYWYGADPKTGGGAQYCMERLMRTELARVQTEAQKQSFIRNGFDMYTFLCNEHSSRSGTCSICRGLNGKHFKVADMMPGENAPPMHPHCRCSTAAYEDSKEYEAWLDYLANGGTTEEWNALKQKGEKFTLDKTPKSGILKLADIVIAKSVGAKSKNFEVMDLATGEMFNFVEGTKIQNVEVFAGKGSKTPYRKAYVYANAHGGKEEDWQHVKGFGWLETPEGDMRAEVHWSQCEGIGKYDFFVKRWLDE
jgi:SPP1 gp7 family putative phage head morphogenesis protein